MKLGSLRQNAARSLVWTLVESGGLSGMSLLTLIVLARLLSPAEMGVGTIALGVVQVLIVPVEILFQDALIQHPEVEDAHFDTAFTFTLALAVSMFLLACAGAGALAWFVNAPGIGTVFIAMSLSILPMGVGTIMAARQRRDLEFRSLALRSLVGRLGGAAVGIGVAVYGGGVWALVAQQVLLVAFAAVVLWLMATRRPRLRFSMRHFHDLIGFGLRSVLVMSVQVSVPRVFTLLAGSLLGAASVGYITIAFRAVDMLRDVVAGAVVQLALPLFGRMQGEADGLRSAYAEAVSLTCLIGFPLFVGLSACAPDVVALLFGPQWQPSVPYVALFGVLVVPYLLRLYMMPCVAAQGRPLAALPGLLVTLFVVVVGMETVGRWSLVAAAAVWTLRLAVGTPVDAVMLRRVSGIGFRTQVAGAGFPLLASVAMAAVVLGVWALVTAGVSVILRIATMAGTGAVVYSGLMLILDRDAVTRLLRFARSAIARPRGSATDSVQNGGVSVNGILVNRAQADGALEPLP